MMLDEDSGLLSKQDEEVVKVTLGWLLQSPPTSPTWTDDLVSAENILTAVYQAGYVDAISDVADRLAIGK